MPSFNKSHEFPNNHLSRVMLPNFTALRIGTRPSDPDDVLRAELVQLALELDIKSMRNWLNTHREFTRVADDPSIWKEVVEQLAVKYPYSSNEISEHVKSGMEYRSIWLIMARRFKECGDLTCDLKLFMKPNTMSIVDNDVSGATFVTYLKPVNHNLFEGVYSMPCGDRDGCTNTLLWHACVPSNREIVYADNIPLVPESEVSIQQLAHDHNFEMFIERQRAATEGLTFDLKCNRDLFRYNFTIQATYRHQTFTFNTFPWMSMCREETTKWSTMLGSMSCEPLLYMWEGPVTISEEIQAILDDIGEDVFYDSSEDLPYVVHIPMNHRWWFYIGVLPDEPQPNRMRLRLREFGLWREDRFRS